MFLTNNVSTPTFQKRKLYFRKWRQREMEVARLKGKFIFRISTYAAYLIRCRLNRTKILFYSISIALRDEELKRVRVAQMADRQRAAAISIER